MTEKNSWEIKMKFLTKNIDGKKTGENLPPI